MRLAWPIGVSMVSHAVMTLVDTLFVSWIGTSELAGVALAGTLVWWLICFPFGLLRATKVLVSQSIGAGDRHEVGAYLTAALLTAAGLGCAILAGGLLASRALGLFTTTAEATIAAEAYFRVRILGTPILLVTMALREARYGVGDSRKPMVATVSANLFNAGMTPLLVFGAGLGVAGAAWATNLAYLLDLVVLVALVGRQEAALRRPGAGHVAALWTIGLPTGLQFVLEMGSFAVLAVMISKMGDVAMAAHQIALQVIHFSFLPAFALAEAASVLVGQAVGAGQNGLVRPLARMALKVAAAYTGACGLFFALGGGWLAHAFTDDPALIAMATRLLLVAAVFQAFDAAYIVSRSALRGAGDVRFPAVVGVIVSWSFTPPLTWALGYRLGWGATGGWIGICVELVIGASILWWRLERDNWVAAANAAREAREAASCERAGDPVAA
jgi:MATE family multidrug resistance protein